MLKLWKFEWDSDYSLIVGLFKVTDEDIENLIGCNIRLGEVCGKHSDVYGTIERYEIKLISDVDIVVQAVPEFGYNPLKYIE